MFKNRRNRFAALTPVVDRIKVTIAQMLAVVMLAIPFMTKPFKCMVAIAILSIAAVSVSAQMAQNTSSASASPVTASPKTETPTDKERELLERIEKLERRLGELEQRAYGSNGLPRGDTSKSVISPNVGSNAVAAVSKKDPTETADSHPIEVQDKPKFLEEGIIPHSIKIPGTDLSLKLGGYIKSDFIQDLDGIGNRSQFSTNTIPVNGTSNADLDSSTNIQARETRVTLELVGGAEKRKFRAYVEGDFYGDNNAFRLRQAYGEYGNLLAGQTWTTFMDFSARPRTLDYEGPDGEIFVRQAMIRWTQALSQTWKFAVAVESPTVQIVPLTGLTGSAQGNVPDFTGFLRYQKKRGHFQVAGLLRSIRFDGTGTTANVSTTGWGFNSTFKINPFGKDQLMGQFAFGSGIGRYIESTSGQNVDAVFSSANNLAALPGRAAMFGYERHWSPKLMSAFAYSIADISYNTGFGGTVIKRTQDGRVNLIWTPYKLVDLGVEYLWGRRDNQNGSRGDATRLQFSTIYRFN